MTRILLEAGADVNQSAGDEGLPNVLFWATYWGELELIKLFINLSKHRLDLTVRKYTEETIFDVARTSQSFATMRKPRHIAKLPLPGRPAVVYEKIAQMLEEYRVQHPDDSAYGLTASGVVTSSTTATAATWAEAEERSLVSRSSGRGGDSTMAPGDAAGTRAGAADAAPAPPSVPATSLAERSAPPRRRTVA